MVWLLGDDGHVVSARGKAVGERAEPVLRRAYLGRKVLADHENLHALCRPCTASRIANVARMVDNSSSRSCAGSPVEQARANAFTSAACPLSRRARVTFRSPA